MMQNDIIPMTDEHIDEAYEIELSSFTEPWTKNMLISELSNPLARYYVVKKDGKVVGYAGVQKILDIGELTNIAVKEDYRGEGIASCLMEKIIDFCKKNKINILNLEVRENNLAALNMYKKFGFYQVGRRKNYYQNPTEAAILMSKEINK